MMELYTVASGSKGNCHILNTEKGQLLIECGVANRTLIQAMAYDFRKLHGCIISHAHNDHSRDRSELVNYGVNIFAPYDFMGDEARLKHKWATDTFTVYSIPLMNPKTLHWLHTDGKFGRSECPVYAFFILACGKVIFYITDAAYCPYNLSKRKINTMIIGCNYEDDAEVSEAKRTHVYRGHLSLNTVKDMLRVNQTDSLEHVILCHLSQTADWGRILREVKEVVGPNVTVNIAEPKRSLPI